MDFPCRNDKVMAIKMCDAGVQWRWEKGEDGITPQNCKYVITPRECNVDNPKMACSGAPYDVCPKSQLEALISAWIQMGKINSNKK